MSGTSDLSATYGIEIDIEGVDTAENAAEALEKLRDKITEDTAAIGAMNKALRNMQGGMVVNVQGFKQLRAQIAAKKVELAQSSSQLVKMKGAFEGLGAAAKKTGATLDREKAFERLKGEFLGAERSIGGVHLSTLKAAGGFGAMAVGVAAVTVALGAAFVAMVKFGAAAADARRNEAIDIQAAGTRIWLGYGQAVRFVADETEAGARAIVGALDRVSNATTIGRARVAGFAEQLEQAGLRGQALETSLKAVSTAASVGKEGGLVAMFAALRFAGVGVDTLAARIQSKLGPLVERKLLSLDSQFQRLRENFARLFQTVDVVPLLKALDKVIGLFSQTKVFGYALRQTLEAMFPTKSAKTFGDVAVQVFKQGLIFGLQFVAGVLELELALLSLKKTIEDVFKSETLTKINSFLDGADKFLSASLQIAGSKLGLDKIVDNQPDFLKAIDRMTGLGEDLSAGVADGIDKGAPNVDAAISRLGKGAFDRLRTDTETHSPSALFARVGAGWAAGTEVGVERGTQGVSNAVSDMGSAAVAATPRATAQGKGGVQLSIVFNEGAIQLKGGTATEMVQDFEEQLSSALERAAQRFTAQLEVA